jgi:hypothetical protein
LVLCFRLFRLTKCTLMARQTSHLSSAQQPRYGGFASLSPNGV